MKKILLSCVTCLLALGLVTACEDEVEDVTPEDPSAGVVEPGENDGGSTEKGEDFLPVLGTVTAGDYFLGIEVDSVPYYFDGEVYQSYYGEVSENGYEAVVVTVAEVTGGYTLSFVDSDETTQYIAMSESGTHRNFVWSEETPYVWSYDTTFNTFVALDSEGVYYYMGTYGTYKEMAMNAYSYLEEGASTSAQYPAHLYDVITYVAPTTITVTAEGEASVELGQSVSLTATATGESEKGEEIDPRVVWSSSAEGVAAVDSNGLVRGLGTGTATITATSACASSVTGSVMITVTDRGTATYQNSETIVPGDYYSYVTGSSLDLTNQTTYGSLVDITYVQNSGTTKPQYYVNGASIRMYALNQITFTIRDSSSVAEISSVVITYTSSYGGNEFAEVTHGENTVGTVTKPEGTDTLTLSLAEGAASTSTLTLTNWTSSEHYTANQTDSETGVETKYTSGGTQLRIESITINYAQPTDASANTGR